MGLASFFCSAETAFIGLQKLRLQHLLHTGHSRAKIVAKILERPERFLATVLLGINFFETAIATLGTVIAISLWGENLGTAIATIVITIVTLVFVEYIPKTLATRHRESIVLNYARPMEFIMIILYPFIYILDHISIRISKPIGEDEKAQPTISQEEFRTAITVGEAEGVLEKVEAEMLHRVFEFGDHPVKEAMTPRPDIVGVPKGMTLKELLDLYTHHSYTRFPVYGEDTDEVIGILSIKDILRAQAKGDIGSDSSLDSLLRPAIFVPDTKRIGQLFAEMQVSGNHMAIVVDEFGSIDGLVTMEQLLEELVGQMGDELGWRGQEFKAIDEHTFELDGSMRVEEANEELGLALPSGDEYETVAGYVLHALGHIPKEGEQIKQDKLRLIVTKMGGMRIEKLRVIKEGD